MNVQFWSQGHTSESSEYFHSLIVSPNSVLEGSCESLIAVGLKFFRKELGVSGEVKSSGLVDFGTYILYVLTIESDSSRRLRILIK